MQWHISISHPATVVVRYSSKGGKKKKKRKRNETAVCPSFLFLAWASRSEGRIEMHVQPFPLYMGGSWHPIYGLQGGYRIGRLRMLRKECDVSRPLCIDKHFSNQGKAAVASMAADHPLIDHHYRGRIKRFGSQ